MDVFALLPFGFGKNSVHSSQLQGGYVLSMGFLPNGYMTYIQRIGKNARLTNLSFLGAYTQIKQIVLSVENFAVLALSSSSNSSHCLWMKQSGPIVGNQNHNFSDSGREDKTAAQLMSKVQVAPSCQQLLLQTS